MLTPELTEITMQYLDNKISLVQLEDWLVPMLPFYYRTPHSDSEEFVTAIEEHLSSISYGMITETEFRKSLKDLLENQTLYCVHFDDLQSTNITGAENTPQRQLIPQIYTPTLSLSS